MLVNCRQTRRGNRLANTADFFIRQMQCDLAQQFGEFFFKDLPGSFQEQVAALPGGAASQDQDVLDIVKISIVGNAIAEVGSHGLPDLECP